MPHCTRRPLCDQIDSLRQSFGQTAGLPFAHLLAAPHLQAVATAATHARAATNAPREVIRRLYEGKTEKGKAASLSGAARGPFASGHLRPSIPG